MYKIKNKYDKLFIELDKVNNDNEMSHFIQDKIYRKFIASKMRIRPQGY